MSSAVWYGPWTLKEPFWQSYLAGVTEPDIIGIAEIVFANAFLRAETMVVGSEVEAKYNSFGTW